MDHIRKIVKKHHFHWAILVAFLVADASFLIGKIEDVYAAGTTLAPVSKSTCTSIPGMFDSYGMANGLDCYQVTSPATNQLYFFSGCVFGGCPYYGYLFNGSGIQVSNSGSGSSLTSYNYLYAVSKPTVATPFPTGLSTLGYVNNGKVKYTDDPNNLPFSRTYNKSTNTWTLVDDPDHGIIAYPCGGMPSGWGCFYVDNSWSDNFNTYYRYAGGTLAHPPVASLSVSCAAVSEKSGVASAYKNMEWTANVTNAGTGTTYTWTTNSLAGTGVSSNNIYRGYVNPAAQATAAVTVTSVIGGATKTASATCPAKTPLPNAIGLSCKGEKVNTTIDGQPKNVKWIADTNWGSDHTFSWTGNIVGSTNPIYGYITPGQTGTESVSSIAKFPGNTVVNSGVAQCGSVKIDPITTKCVATKQDNGVPGSPGFTNVLYKASAFSGAINLTTNAKFGWELATTTGVSLNVVDEESSSLRAYIAPGQSGAANVTSNVNSVDGNKISCTPTISIAPITTKCNAILKDSGTPGTSDVANVELMVSAISGTTNYANLANFDWLVQYSTSSSMVALDSHASTTNIYVTPGNTAKIAVTATLDGVITSVCNDTIFVPKLEAKCTAREFIRGKPGSPTYTNVAFTGTATKGTNVTNSTDFDWTLSSTIDGVKTEVPVEGNNTKTVYAYALPGKTLTAKVKANVNGSQSENDNNTCSILSPDSVAVSCSAESPMTGYLLWKGKFSFEVDGVEYNEKNYKPNSVTWATDKQDPFQGYDPILMDPPARDPMAILNFYDVNPLPAGPSLQKNTMTINLTIPTLNRPPVIVRNSKFLASIYNAIFAVEKEKKITEKVSCEAYVPISTGTLSEKILHAAEFAAKSKLRPDCSDVTLGCAVATNAIVQLATGQPIDSSDDTADMVKSLLSNSKRFEKKYDGGGSAKASKGVTLKEAMANLYISDQKALRNAKPGDIIISPTVGAKHGHVGVIQIVEPVNDTPDPNDSYVKIISNSSSKGHVSSNMTGDYWYNYYVRSSGLKLYIFRGIK